MPATVSAIYRHYEAKRKNEHRPHLGGSQVGHECDRYLWYQFHWCASPQFEGRILRLFETGDREEDRLISNLRAIGVTVWSRDPDTGKQIRFEAHGGHFAVNLDGVGEGFAESKQAHVLEFKTMNEKAFRDISRRGLAESKPVYFAQVQIAMHLSGLQRAYFLATNKNNDEIYGERVRVDASFGITMVARAARVIFSERPLARISDDAAWWQCKFCEMHGICHGGRLPEVNCRTCAHSTARQDGTWHCARHDTVLSVEDQRAGCPQHLYNPFIMPWQVHDSGRDWVEYTTRDGEIIRNEGNSLLIYQKGMEL